MPLPQPGGPGLPVDAATILTESDQEIVTHYLRKPCSSQDNIVFVHNKEE